MSQFKFPLGQNTVRVPFSVRNASGALSNADSLPTVFNVQKNGSDSTESYVTISQMQDDTPSNITGMYYVVLDLSSSGLNTLANDTLVIDISATVDGTSIRSHFSVVIEGSLNERPEIQF